MTAEAIPLPATSGPPRRCSGRLRQRAVTIAAIVTSIGLSAAGAQAPLRVVVGDTIRYSLTADTVGFADPVWRTATVLGLTGDTLVARAVRRGAVPRAVDLDSVFMLYVSRGRELSSRNHATYAGAGGVAGFVALAFRAIAFDRPVIETGHPVTDIVTPLALGAVVGVLYASMRPGPRHWEWVALREPQGPSAPDPPPN